MIITLVHISLVAAYVRGLRSPSTRIIRVYSAGEWLPDYRLVMWRVEL
jgi:hypothetical protein